MKNSERIALLNQVLATLKADEDLDPRVAPSPDFIIATYNLERVLTSLAELEQKFQARPARGSTKKM